MNETQSKEHGGHNCHSSNPKQKWWILGVCLTLGAIAVLLFTEHRAHVLGILPYAFLFACPLMHLFMHRGGHHHSASNERTGER